MAYATLPSEYCTVHRDHPAYRTALAPSQIVYEEDDEFDGVDED